MKGSIDVGAEGIGLSNAGGVWWGLVGPVSSVGRASPW
jgi:hypothetical protein